MLESHQTHFDFLIIGGGLIGSSLAMELSRLNTGARIGVTDLDLEGVFSSSELNAGGVRATFSQPLNILFSKESIQYFDQHKDQVGYLPVGYLWLRTPEQLKKAEQSLLNQSKQGWSVEVWDTDLLKRKTPFIDKVEKLGGAVFSPRDGLINPNLLKKHYQSEAKKRGVQFIDRMWFQHLDVPSQGSMTAHFDQYPKIFSEQDRHSLFTFSHLKLNTAQPVKLNAACMINCAGAWARVVAQRMGYDRPVKAIRRQVCLFDSRDVNLSPYGMVIGPNSIYFHPEATHGLAGFADYSEKEGHRFDYEQDVFFNEIIWPGLFEISSKFERIKHLTGWAGLYEVSPDDSAIMGEVHEISKGRVFEAHSFSGHGTMHSYAAGRALAERISLGKYDSIDATLFNADRFKSGKLLKETAVI